MQTTSIIPHHHQPKTKYFTGHVKKINVNDSQTFNDDSIVCGDGTRQNGVSLRNLVLYGSERMDGGLESYYEIDPETLMLTTRGARRGGNWRTRPLTERGKAWKQTPVPRINIPAKKRNDMAYKQKVLRRAAIRWMYMNRGVALSIGCIAGRDDIDDIERFLVREAGEIYQKQTGDNCMAASIINALDVVRGREVAAGVKEYLKEHGRQFIHLRDSTSLLHHLGTRAEMRKIKKNQRKSYDANRFGFLASVAYGVYIVHLKQHGTVDHAVVVDANRKLILDSEEKYPMRLSEDLLRRCGGKKATNLKVENVRLIVDQALSNRSNHSS